MDTFRSLICAYGLGDFASDIGVPVNTAKQMRKRDSVAPEYWDAWVRGAVARDRDDVTYERLAKIAAARRAPVTVAAPTAEASAA